MFAKHSDIPKEEYIKAIEMSVPKKFLELNLKAFEMGYALD
jgi:indolepyruvate ferredoxin oxidoreductase beta subunit